VLRVVSEITGIDDLESDPSLYAGGLSKMVKGDFLNPHIDNSHDGSRRRYRRLNLLFYVSPSFSLENGGCFELWNRDVTEPVTLASKCNRLIVMQTGDQTYHSVSEIKSESPRCCVSNYFFSKSSPKTHDYYHVTSFTGRPDQLFQRWYGSLDNYLRNSVAKVTGVSRGKGQARHNSR
jgi:Rps23 Pro-64 3,4-dihydroxylase Tpa1-like proline 4-hydroxylase